MSDLRLSTVADYARSLLIDAMQNMLYKFLLCLRQQGMAAYPDDTSRPRFTNESNAQVLLKETHTPRATIRCGLPQGSPRIADPDPAFSRPFFFLFSKRDFGYKDGYGFLRATRFLAACQDHVPVPGKKRENEPNEPPLLPWPATLVAVSPTTTPSKLKAPWPLPLPLPLPPPLALLRGRCPLTAVSP